jgi:hypothetical protein
MARYLPQVGAYWPESKNLRYVVPFPWSLGPSGLTGPGGVKSSIFLNFAIKFRFACIKIS